MRLCWRDIRPSFLKYNPKTTAIPEIIPVVLICTAGFISAGRIHPQLALFFHRDYFCRPDSSPACSFLPLGLFPSAGFISIFLFCSTGMISPRSDASLSCSFLPQGLFPPAGCISIFLFCPTGIISAGRMHPQLALFFHWDYFCQPNASLIRAPVKYQRPNFYYTGNTRMASADTLCKKLLPDRQE